MAKNTTSVREVEGFLAQAKKDYASICKKITSAELKIEQLKLARDDNEHLQSYLQGEINALS